MLFISPAFMFAFLPLTILIYTAVKNKFKKYAVFVIGIAFLILSNLNNVITLLLFVFMWLGTYLVAHLVVKFNNSRFWTVFGSVFMAASYFAVRFLYKTIISERFVLDVTLGCTMCAICSVSFIVDVYRRDAPLKFTLYDIAMYMSFYPTSLIGPVVKYKDFIHLINNIDFNMKNSAAGVRLFMLGIIKKQMISVALLEFYNEIISYSKTVSNLFIGILSMLIFYVLVYFTISGYSDIARGLALMLGIKIDCDFGDNYFPVSPKDYVSNFFISMHSFLMDYVAKPIRNIRWLNNPLAKILSTSIMCILFTTWLNMSPASIVASIPFIIIFCVEQFVDLKAFLERHMPIKILSALSVIILFSFYWLSFKYNTVGEMFKEISILINANTSSFDIFFVYAEAFNIKYMISLAIMLSVLFLQNIRVKYVEQNPQTKFARVFYITSNISIVLLFILVMFNLSGKPEYAVNAFNYLFR